MSAYKSATGSPLTPYMINLLYLPTQPMMCLDMWRLATKPGSTAPYLFEQWCGFFYVPKEPDKCKCCEMGPTVFHPHARRLEGLSVCRCHYNGSTSSPFFKEPECWSCQGSNPQHSAQQTGAYPTELTRQQFKPINKYFIL